MSRKICLGSLRILYLIVYADDAIIVQYMSNISMLDKIPSHINVPITHHALMHLYFQIFVISAICSI